MRTLAIRLRLALVFAAAAAVLLTGVGTFGYVRLAAGFSDDVNLELRQRVQDLVGPLSRPGATLREVSGTGFIERGESFAEVVTPSGQVVESTPTLRGQGLVTPIQATSASRRMLTVDLPDAPGSTSRHVFSRPRSPATAGPSCSSWESPARTVWRRCAASATSCWWRSHCWC